MEGQTITKEQYIINKLEAEVGTLKGSLAEAEFTVLLLRQEIQKLKDSQESEETVESEDN